MDLKTYLRIVRIVEKKIFNEIWTILAINYDNWEIFNRSSYRKCDEKKEREKRNVLVSWDMQEKKKDQG